MVAAAFILGIRYDSTAALIGAALLLGILNAFVRPILLILGAPANAAVTCLDRVFYAVQETKAPVAVDIGGLVSGPDCKVVSNSALMICCRAG